jgi:AcrR family transcriptional regulator
MYEIPQGKSFQKFSTKDSIFFTAVRMFSDKGCQEVSMRDLAKEVGIRVATIYSHYASKQDLLELIYDFYKNQWNKAKPNYDEILRGAQSLSPFETLNRLEWHFPPELQDTMNRIVIIAISRLRCDEVSMRFVRELVMDGVSKPLTAVLERLVELGKIETPGIESFVSMYAYFCFGVAALDCTELGVSYDRLAGCQELIFSYIKPTGK